MTDEQPRIEEMVNGREGAGVVGRWKVTMPGQSHYAFKFMYTEEGIVMVTAYRSGQPYIALQTYDNAEAIERLEQTFEQFHIDDQADLEAKFPDPLRS